MIKTLVKYSCLVLAAVTSTAFANNQTVSLGYAQFDVNDFKNLKGVNAQYHYETQSPWGAVVSSTYASAKESDSIGANEGDEAKVKYFSLLAGPSYRFNEYVSTYALLGFARGKITYDSYDYSTGNSFFENNSLSKTSFAYGVGVAVNPMEQLTVNVGYEGTSFNGVYDQKAKFNGFNIGVGYRF